MTTYYLETGGVAGSDDLDVPAQATKTFSQWGLGGYGGTAASAPPGPGSNIISMAPVSVPGLMGTLNVGTWTVQGNGGGGLGSVGDDFINGTLTIGTIIPAGTQNYGFIVTFSYNPYNPSDPDAQSPTATLNVTQTPDALASGAGSIINAETVGAGYSAAIGTATIIAANGAVINADTVATSGATHLVAIVTAGTLTVQDEFNDWASLTVSQAGTVIMNGSMDPAADTKTGPWNNTITVTGQQSSFVSNYDTFTVGGGSAQTGIRGTFSVLQGATAELNGDLTVGNASLDVGMITVSNDGSSLRVNGDVNLGNKGEGDLTVSAGASFVVYGAVKEAVETGAPLTTGGDLFTGTDTDIDIHGEWQIGVEAARTDTISMSAQVVVDGALTLGVEAGGQGTLNVQGQDTTLTEAAANEEVVIGQGGTGILRISQGAEVDFGASEITVGDESEGSQNSQNLLDINAASMTAGSLTIGGGGSGNLTMEDGADLTVLADLTLGDESGSKYNANIQQSSLSIAGELVVGSEGTTGSGLPAANGANNAAGTQPPAGGNMLLNGSEVDASSVTLAEEAGSKGVLVVDESSLTIDDDLTVGSGGTGTMLVQLGASVEADSITLGEEFGGSGSMTIDQSVVISQEMKVGSQGKGSLTIQDGGLLVTASDASIAEQIVANVQSVTVKAGEWSVGGDLTVGDAGIGTLSLSDDGLVDGQGDVKIGDQTSAGGVVTVTGSDPTGALFSGPGGLQLAQALSFASGLPVGNTGSVAGDTAALLWAGTLEVGGSGTGTLTVTNSGLVAAVADGTGAVEIASDAGSSGTLSLASGSLLIASTVAVGGGDDAAGGTGVLSVASGAQAQIGTVLTLWPDGSVNVSKGGAVAIGGAAAADGTITVGIQGTLAGAGTISGAVNDAGLLDVSGGALSIKGGALTATGTVQIEADGTLDLAGAKGGDTVASLPDLGSLDLGAGTLTVTGAYSNANWGSGDTFDPMAGVSGVIVGEGAALTVAGSAVTNGADGPILTFTSIAGGLQQASFTLENSGDGAAITAAIQTGGLTLGDVSGIAAGNVTLASGESSGVYTLTYDPSKGSLDGQTLTIESDFANVAPITIQLAAATPLQVTDVAANMHGEAVAGDTVALTVTLSAPVTVDTTGGMPSLTLNDGAVAEYDAAASDPAAGLLVFDDVVASGDHAPDLAIAAVNPGGAVIEDGAGDAPDFSAAIGQSIGLQIGAVTVASVQPSQTTPATTGEVFQIALALSQGVTVDTSGGTPTLALSDGETATYDAGASDPGAGALVFDGTVAAGDHAADLAITAVNPDGASIHDANGDSVDFSAALDQPIGLQIGASPLTVTAIAASPTGAVAAGSIALTLDMSEAATVDTAGGLPSLALNDGGMAYYDAALSNPSAGSLVFDALVSPGQYASDLAVTGVDLNGATITDADGYAADFSAALNVATGAEPGATGIAFVSYSGAGEHLQAGDTITITLHVGNGVTVTGTPTLALSDGAAAIYDAGASSPATGLLAFDYAVGSSDYTTDLQVIAASLNGGTIADTPGHAVDLSDAAANLGLDVNAAFVQSVTTSPGSGFVTAGASVALTLAIDAAVTVTGAPTLLLSNGATACYDASASTPSAGSLVFDYVVGASDESLDLGIAGVELNGGTVTDAAGRAVDLSAASDTVTGLQIGTPLTVSAVSASASGEVDAGQTVALTLTMSEAVTVTGTPTLSLNDDASAIYDAAASDPAAGNMVFDYVVGTVDSTANLEITGVTLPDLATVQDAQGFSADFNAALNQPTGVTVGPALVTAVSTSQSGVVPDGQTLQLSLVMNTPVTVTGDPILALNNAATASFDAALSNATTLVFDYTVSTDDASTPDLEIGSVTLPAGSAITETANGLAANLGGAVGVSTGVQINSPLSFIGALSESSTGTIVTGDTLDIRLEMNEPGTIDTAGGVPTITLNDGGTATYNAAASYPAEGDFDFFYTPGSADTTLNLTIVSVNLNGATMVDANGYQADLSGASGAELFTAVNPMPQVTSVSAFEEGNASEVSLYLYTNETVVVTGSPVLILNDGGTATYDSAEYATSDLAFNYTIAAGQQTPNLEIAAIDLDGATVQDQDGDNIELTPALNAPTGVEIDSPLTVTGVAAVPDSGEVAAGQTVQVIVQASEPVVVNTTSGTPTLKLSLDGEFGSSETGIYDATASDLATGKLVFDYVVQPGDESPTIGVDQILLNGGTIEDSAGYQLIGLGDEPSAVDIYQTIDLQIGLVFVTGLSDSLGDTATEIVSGQSVQLYLDMSSTVTVTGAPTLVLNNGDTASFDAAASTGTVLAFDYTVGTNDSVAQLGVAAIDLSGGAAITDANGVAADLSAATTQGFELQIGPDVVQSVTAEVAAVYPGQSDDIYLEWALAPLTVSGGTPTLTLSNGGRATYNSFQSTYDNLDMVFDYTAGTNAVAGSDLTITGVNLNGATVTDANGTPADFSGALNAATGIDVFSTPPEVAVYFYVHATPPGYEYGAPLLAGQTLQVSLEYIGFTGGSPTITFNDGGTGTYDAAASSSWAAVFDYVVGPDDHTPDLAITGLSLNGATGTDPYSSEAVDYADAVPQELGYQVGLSPLDVQAVTVSTTLSSPGETVELTLAMSEPVTFDDPPDLSLSNGEVANYDSAASNPSGGTLVFNYVVAAGDATPSLEIAAVDQLLGVGPIDAAGYLPDYSAAVNVPIGLEITPLEVLAVTATPGGPTTPGEQIQIALQMSEPVAVDVSGGLPTLTLNDGATATYNNAASQPGSGLLIFDMTVGPSDLTSDLAVTAVTLPAGSSVQDANGYVADFSGALNVPTGLRIGPSPLTVTAVTATPGSGEVDAGQAITLTLTMSEAVTVDTTNGTPTLALNDGGTAVYDAANSDPAAGLLVFDDTVASSDSTPDLTVAQVYLNGATVQDASSANADFTAALNLPAGLQVGPAFVTSVQTYESGTADTGETVHLAAYISQDVTVTGDPSLSLNDGGTALYDAAASGPQVAVFDYVVGPSDSTPDLTVTAVNLNGGAITDASGTAVNLLPAINAATGLEVTSEAVCFCAGTLITTPAGEVPVERLKPGDHVLTLRGESRRIVWIGTGQVMVARGRRSAATPVIVRKGALGDNLPHRDLHVTKGHSLLVDDVLVPVEFLVNHRTILWDDWAQEVKIYHIELETHDVLLANGAPAESYRDDGNRWLFQNANSGWGLPPQAPCAPVRTGGEIVDAIWRRLLERAGPRRGAPLTDDPDLHLMVDGKRIDPMEQSGDKYVFRLAKRPHNVRIVSRSAVPQELGIARDARLLGVAVKQMVLAQARRQRTLSADAACLTDGYHDFEPANGIRWTCGDAAVPAELFAGTERAAMLILHLGGMTEYLDEGSAVRRRSGCRVDGLDATMAGTRTPSWSAAGRCLATVMDH